MVLNISQVQNLAQNRRTLRRPQHSFQLRYKPWQIQPFLIAPVLPGETMRNLLLQARVVTDPIRNPLIGWWSEHYFFYVKHRDLNIRDDLTQMVLDPAKDMSPNYSSANVQTYHYGAAVDWSMQCLERVTEEYFRNEGEAWDGFLIDGLPAASISRQDWTDSVCNDADMVLQDVELTVGADDKVTGSELEDTLQQWMFLRQHNLVADMSYEDYLRSFGVRRSEAEDPHRPELVRYVRDWTYPTNTVDPSSGAPSSAAVWSVAERADKDRFFSEPGFLFGVTVCRPKVYLSGQKGSAASAMQDAYSWLPSALTNDLRVSLRKFTSGTGPLQGVTDDYWVDVRDLLLYGDQFVNFALTETDAGFVALPTAGLGKRYASEVMADLLFKDETVDGKQLIRSDGIVSLGIATRQRDATASN